MYKIVLIALKRFSFRITFIRVGLFSDHYWQNIKRVLLNKIAKTAIFRLYAIQKSQLRKALIEEQGG
jgi:hypothetical protein